MTIGMPERPGAATRLEAGSPAPSPPGPPATLDPSTVLLGSLASVLGAVLASAAGSGFVATMVVAALAPC